MATTSPPDAAPGHGHRAMDLLILIAIFTLAGMIVAAMWVVASRI